MPNTQESAARAQSPRLEVIYTRADGFMIMKAIEDGKVFDQVRCPPTPKGVRWHRRGHYDATPSDAELLALCAAQLEATADQLRLNEEFPADARASDMETLQERTDAPLRTTMEAIFRASQEAEIPPRREVGEPQLSGTEVRPGYQVLPPGRIVAALWTGKGQTEQLWELRRAPENHRDGRLSFSDAAPTPAESCRLAWTILLLGCRSMLAQARTRLRG